MDVITRITVYTVNVICEDLWRIWNLVTDGVVVSYRDQIFSSGTDILSVGTEKVQEAALLSREQETKLT
jgi:hypothetical protein